MVREGAKHHLPLPYLFPTLFHQAILILDSKKEKGQRMTGRELAKKRRSLETLTT